ncbi:transcription factor Tfb4 [Pisolithus microcarpus]|nr:transcription factor Tfb4 [Pisolithus microcarpus]
MDSEVDKPSHLSVILDLSPTQWYLSARATNPYPLTIGSFLSQLLAFLNAHIEHASRLRGFSRQEVCPSRRARPARRVMLYTSTEALVDEPPPLDANSYPPFRMVDTTVTRQILRELDAIEPGDEQPCALVGALTKALCYINRITLPSTSSTNVAEGSTHLPDPRILILSVSPDLSSSYIPIMNAIFSAQKLAKSNLLTSAKSTAPTPVFLQQAAHLTNGSYIYLERRDALLQYLIMSFLPPPLVRKVLTVPRQDKIDFRAACFCHKNIVDVGFVCSVCLSIFCQPVPVCSTCRTKFPIKALQRLKSACPSPAPAPPRPLANLNNAVPRTTEATNHSTPGLR